MRINALIEELRRKDTRSVAILLSLIEDEADNAEKVLKKIWKHMNLHPMILLIIMRLLIQT